MLKKFCYAVFFSFLISPHVVLSKGELAVLHEDTWSEILTGEWMVDFYAPWCPACQQLEPLWKEFAEWSDDLSIKVGSVDITVNPGLSGRFMITALPTIFHVKDGVFRLYRGSRDKDSFISFVEEKKWQSIDPVPSWKSPQSYQMATISGSIRVSMLLRSMHNTLVEDYGIPHWGSYIIFGLLTMLVGALLGLLFVFAIDFFCPSRMGYQPPRSPNTPQERVTSLPRVLIHFIQREHDSGGEYEGEDVIRNDVDEDNEIRRRREPPNEAENQED